MSPSQMGWYGFDWIGCSFHQCRRSVVQLHISQRELGKVTPLPTSWETVRKRRNLTSMHIRHSCLLYRLTTGYHFLLKLAAHHSIWVGSSSITERGSQNSLPLSPGPKAPAPHTPTNPQKPTLQPLTNPATPWPRLVRSIPFLAFVVVSPSVYIMP